ncbi:MAG: tryptophan synthase subunit beta, partial [Candidatus Sumerlaeota bacterium]|nr:tryptophan synthase subunit beta [Candidatus Sumerlaeota bacterium]
MTRRIPFPLPDSSGHYGPFGGRYVPETLMCALIELEREYNHLKKDPDFKRELRGLLADYA